MTAFPSSWIGPDGTKDEYFLTAGSSAYRESLGSSFSTVVVTICQRIPYENQP
jgi:hypothetical protein